MKIDQEKKQDAVIRFILIICFSLITNNMVLGNSETPFAKTKRIQTGGVKNNDVATSIVIQADGKIVAVGSARSGVKSDFAIVRYNPDGSLDPSLDGDGKATTDIGANSYDDATSVAIQPDGTLIVAGWTASGANTSFGISDNDFAVVRYKSNGSLDTSFGKGGKVVTNFGTDSSEAIAAVAIQADGKIVAVGSTDNGSSDDFAIARYNPDGTLDTSFDNDGKVITSLTKFRDSAHAVVIQPDGKIVIAGETFNSPYSVFAVLRYKANGSLDTTFDGDGIVTTQIGTNSDVANAVAVLPNGKIVAAGSSFGQTSGIPGAYTSSGDRFALVKYNSDGSLDTSFGQGGKALTVVRSKARAFATSAALQSDGKIIVAGYLANNITVATNITAARFNANGSVDTSFGQSGIIISKIGTGAEQANSVAIQSEGKIVIGGYAFIVSGVDFVLIRYNGNGEIDTSFDKDGKVTTDMAK